MHNILKNILLISLLGICAGCGHRGTGIEEYDVAAYEPQYAQGFEILGAEGKESVVLVTKSPWQGASDPTMLFIARGGEQAPEGFQGQVLDGEARRIVCMSSTHVALLDAIDQTDRVAGVSGLGFITNPKILMRSDVGDVGYDNSINYERLLAINPDLVLLYGVNGINTLEPKLRELGIPFAYIGDYLESSPLGKAEWMVPIAEITGSRQAGEDAFAPIPDNYNRLKEQAAQSASKPLVLLNSPYSDSWVMPPVGSYMVRLIEDAGGQYCCPEITGSQSQPIGMERAFSLGQQADVWLNCGQARTMAQLLAACPKMDTARPVVNGRVYNCTLRATPGGGNDFWESGIAHPDWVLQDLINIFSGADTAQLAYYEHLR